MVGGRIDPLARGAGKQYPAANPKISRDTRITRGIDGVSPVRQFGSRGATDRVQRLRSIGDLHRGSAAGDNGFTARARLEGYVF